MTHETRSGVKCGGYAIKAFYWVETVHTKTDSLLLYGSLIPVTYPKVYTFSYLSIFIA